MVFNEDREAHDVMHMIHRAINAYTRDPSAHPQMKVAQKLLWPDDFMKGMPYFVLTGKVNGKKIFVTPTEVFYVISSSIKLGEYPIMASRALMMQRICRLMNDSSRVPEFNVFADPARAALCMAGIAFVKGEVDCSENPLGFDICFPYGRSLLLDYTHGEKTSDLYLTLASPGLFLAHQPVSDELNTRQGKVFDKLKAYASGGEKVAPLRVRLTSYVEAQKQKEPQDENDLKEV